MWVSTCHNLSIRTRHMCHSVMLIPHTCILYTCVGPRTHTCGSPSNCIWAVPYITTCSVMLIVYCTLISTQHPRCYSYVCNVACMIVKVMKSSSLIKALLLMRCWPSCRILLSILMFCGLVSLIGLISQNFQLTVDSWPRLF